MATSVTSDPLEPLILGQLVNDRSCVGTVAHHARSVAAHHAAPDDREASGDQVPTQINIRLRDGFGSVIGIDPMVQPSEFARSLTECTPRLTTLTSFDVDHCTAHSNATRPTPFLACLRVMLTFCPAVIVTVL